MKRIVLAAGILAAAVGAGYLVYPAEVVQYADEAADGGRWLWAKVEANPVPVVLAIGTFLLTVTYHKAKGKSLRESVAAAATRGAATVPAPNAADGGDNPVVRRAKARAVRTQLMADQIGLQNRLRKLPDELLKAEKETCYTEQALAEAELKVMEKQEVHDAAVEKLEALRKEKAEGDAELAGIEAELKKLADLV